DVPLSVWTACRGVIARVRGQLRVAAVALREAMVPVDVHRMNLLAVTGLAELAVVHALAGDVDMAERLLARAEPPSKLFQPWMEINRAWAIAAGGVMPDAVAQALRAAELARDLNQP